MVPEIVLVAEISRFSLREHSWCETTFCRFSQWGPSSQGDFSSTTASFDTALDAAAYWHHLSAGLSTECIHNTILWQFSNALLCMKNVHTRQTGNNGDSKVFRRRTHATKCTYTLPWTRRSSSAPKCPLRPRAQENRWCRGM